MGSVTIAATYGSGGSIIGPAVAKRLRLPFVDRGIPTSLIKAIHEPLVAALADDSEPRNAVDRVLSSALNYSGLWVGVPISPEELETSPDIARTEDAIRRLPDAGGAVILGRAGVFVLKGRPDVLHVRLDAHVEARRRAAMVHEGLDYKTAARMQQETDHARRAYVAHFYPMAGAWDDPRHYHVVLDSTAISLDTCVDIITQAAKDLFGESAASQKPARRRRQPA
jgi:cytidylate kinase